MQDIETKAIATYNANLLFLEDTDPRLCEKIYALAHAIDQGYYEERYSLEYKDGYFDVLEPKTGTWLYGTSSKVHAEMAAQSINYSKTENVYETFADVRVDDEYAQELQNMDISENSYSGAAGLINYSNKYADKEKTTMKKLYKFIFLGVGLGLHLTTIHEKLQSNVYFIVEEDLELFRLSLFVTNYKDMSSNGAQLLFSIFDDEDTFNNRTNLFLHEHFIYNHYIKFFYLLSHKEKKLKTIQSIIVGQSYLTFNYSALSNSLLRPLQHLKNGYKLLNIGASYKNTIFTQKPLLLLGAGPSFGKNLEWLMENHHRFIVVAVAPLLAKLEELNIRPDIITHIHGFADAMPHVEKVKDISFFDKTICIFGGFTSPDFMKYFKQENVFIFEGSSRYKRWDTGLTSSNIGSIAYGLLLMLYGKEIYLLGLDFAPDQESGSTHSSTHNYVRNVELQEDDTIGGGLVFNTAIIKIKGNFKDEVFTTLMFNDWKAECNAVARSYRKKDNKHTYNLSDGAYIDETIALKPDDNRIASLKKIYKNVTHKRLLSVLNSKSENFLNPEELHNIKLRVDYCDNIINILNTHANTDHLNINQYHYNLLGVFHNILNDEDQVESSDINRAISLYLQFVSGFIFDLINTNEIEDEEILIKHLDNVVIPQIVRVVVYYKKTLQDYLDFIEKK